MQWRWPRGALWRATIRAQCVFSLILVDLWLVSDYKCDAPNSYTGGLRSGVFTGAGVALQGE